MKMCILSVTAATLFLACSGQAKADLAFAIPDAIPPAYTSPIGNDGLMFHVNSDIVVTALDYYVYFGPDSATAGTLQDAHHVGIYDATTHALLGSTIVGPGNGPIVGGGGLSSFLSVPIAPIPLLAGHDYMVVGGETPHDPDNGGPGAGNNTPGIPYGSIGNAAAVTFTGYFYDSSPVLAFPTTPYGTVYVGPNFEFSAAAVPEPATVASWSLLGLCVVGWNMRRKK